MKRAFLLSLLSLTAGLTTVPVAQAAFDDPLFLMRPEPPSGGPVAPVPPRRGTLEGPCGVAVDSAGKVYLSDYYQNAIDVFGANIGAGYPYGFGGQYTDIGPLDGPCGLAVDGTSNIYVNDYHRSVVKYSTFPTFQFPTSVAPIPLATIVAPVLDEAGPTGVAVDPVAERVYVDERDHVAVFDLAGVPLGQIGAGSLDYGYGIAYSAGRIFVPDAATNTVEIYSSTPGSTTPLLTIDGSETPAGHFTSLADAAVAVDNVTGEIYVVDNLNPTLDELPEAVVWVFDSTGVYEGRLKNSIVFGQPSGLAVDNSATASQGRVYVTTGNTDKAALYAYPPGAATSNSIALPQGAAGAVADLGPSPVGAVASTVPGIAPAQTVAGALETPATAAAGKASPRLTAKRRHARRLAAKRKHARRAALSHREGAHPLPGRR